MQEWAVTNGTTPGRRLRIIEVNEVLKLEGGGKQSGKRRRAAVRHRRVPPGAPLLQEGPLKKQCAVAGQQENDGSPQHRMKKSADRAAAPESAHVLPAELGANAAAEASRQLDAARPQQDHQESDASDAMLPAQYQQGLLTEYRARIVTLEDAAMRQSQKHAAAEKRWNQKTEDLQKQLKEQTERADAMQSALQDIPAKDSKLAQQTERANGLQAALEGAKAAAEQAATAGHAELSEGELMLRAITAVQKRPSLKQELLFAIGK